MMVRIVSVCPLLEFFSRFNFARVGILVSTSARIPEERNLNVMSDGYFRIHFIKPPLLLVIRIGLDGAFSAAIIAALVPFISGKIDILFNSKLICIRLFIADVFLFYKD